MCNLKGHDIGIIFQFLSICILAFINEGTSTLSSAFTNEPWSWGLSVPVSLYLKFALEIHSHLGIFVGVGLPSLVYWGATRGSMDWYWATVLKFNTEIMKTGLFNLVIGLLHLLVSKIVHRIIQWVKDHKLEKGSVISKLDESPKFYEEHPLLRPVSDKDIFLKLLELLSVFFYNGNIMLLSWCLSGQVYSYEVGKAISWVSMGSSMFVWIKALIKQFEMPQGPITTEKKAYKVEKDRHCSIQSMESKDLSTCSSEC